MSTVAVAVSELTGAALDWAVAKAVGWENYPDDSIEQGMYWHTGPDGPQFGRIIPLCFWRPSINKGQGFWFIHKFAVTLKPSDPYAEFGGVWAATCITSRERAAHTYYHEEGDTPLIAGMRAIVGAILGDTVSIPTELLEQSE